VAVGVGEAATICSMKGCSCRTAITLNQRLLPLLLSMVLVLPVAMVVMLLLLLLLLEVVDTPVVVVVAGGCAPAALPAQQQLHCKQQLRQQRLQELVPSPLVQQPHGPLQKQARQLRGPVGVAVLLPRASSSSGGRWASCSGSSSGISSSSSSWVSRGCPPAAVGQSRHLRSWG
jgi:hypothetical protein